MADSLKTVNMRETAQSEKAARGQKRNNAGGYTFVIDPMEQAKRFLILGSESSFYQSGAQLSKANATSLIALCEGERHDELVDLIVETSTKGRAPKQNPGVFALAVAASYGTVEQRQYALTYLNEVCRTATTLFMFIGYVEQFRGWGPALRKAVSHWYLSKTVPQLGYQMVKYRAREGWTHRDVFRMAHPKTDNPQMQALGNWFIKGELSSELPNVVQGYEHAKANDNPIYIASLVKDYGLTWEMVPTESLNDVKVWEALLDNGMPTGALLRQLPRLTKLGIIGFGSEWTTEIARQLTSKEQLTKARIHPINLLVALKTYASGESLRGSGTWTANADIIDALDEAFYKAFENVEPTGKRTMLALDVSGSMDWADIAGMPITPREASAALALVTKATEANAMVTAFSTQMTPVNISARQRMDDVVSTIRRIPMGGTDCAQPMIYAKEHKLDIDTFCIYTDNETWAGYVHPHQALEQYRQASGINAKMIVVGMTATRFSIADPKDPGMLDIAGFDTSTPAVISEFSRGL